jgi:hypothetical protein
MLPTTGDLNQFLTGEIGLTVPDIDRLEFWLADAAEQLQQITGIRPFLATEQTRKYDMRRGGRVGHYNRAPLADRLVQLDTPLVGDHPTIATVVKRDGVTLVADEDYWLKPMNNPQRGLPYTYIELLHPSQPAEGGIEVTGPFGYAATTPKTAWTAVLELAAAKFAVDYRTKKSDQPVSWSEGDVSESKAQQLIASFGDKWAENGTMRAERLRLTEMVL